METGVEIKKVINKDLLEKKMLELPQVPMNVVHKFGPGVYMRELHLPQGTTVIGHHQNFHHVNIFLKGKITFFNDEGKAVELVAPMTFVGKPGRKIAYVHEDSIWMNVYATNETDVEKLESHFLTKSEGWFINSEVQRQLGSIKESVDKKDFLEAIAEFGFTEDGVRRISTNESDLINLPWGDYKIKTGKSLIEGTGLFATSDIEKGEPIGPARIDGKRTIIGRFTNHAAKPNAIMHGDSLGDIYLYAIKRIIGSHGGQDGEEITIDYREALKLNLSIGEIKCQQQPQQ